MTSNFVILYNIYKNAELDYWQINTCWLRKFHRHTLVHMYYVYVYDSPRLMKLYFYIADLAEGLDRWT